LTREAAENKPRLRLGVVGFLLAIVVPMTATARKLFPAEEHPTERAPRSVDGRLALVTHRIDPRVEPPRPPSGVRRRVDPVAEPEVARMAAFASRYTSMHDELDLVLDPTRVPLVARNLDLEGLDSKARCVLRFINGVSTVGDVIERSGLDKAYAVAVICKLAAQRAITLV
jgi:hypothetical protein